MFQRILVPLDGSVNAESAIPVAARIARVTGGTLLFLRVIPLPVSSSASGRKPFFLIQKVDDLEYQHVSAYLESLSPNIYWMEPGCRSWWSILPRRKKPSMLPEFHAATSTSTEIVIASILAVILFLIEVQRLCAAAYSEEWMAFSLVC